MANETSGSTVGDRNPGLAQLRERMEGGGNAPPPEAGEAAKPAPEAGESAQDERETPPFPAQPERQEEHGSAPERDVAAEVQNLAGPHKQPAKLEMDEGKPIAPPKPTAEERREAKRKRDADRRKRNAAKRPDFTPPTETTDEPQPETAPQLDLGSLNESELTGRRVALLAELTAINDQLEILQPDKLALPPREPTVEIAGHLTGPDHPVHRAPGNDEDREKQNLIEQLVEYLRPEQRPIEAERLWWWETPKIAEMLKVFRESYGSPDLEEGLNQINALFVTIMADPVHRRAVQEFESQGGKWDRLMGDLRRATGDDVMVSNLNHHNYRDAARAAFEQLGVLQRAVVQIEKYLLYYVPYEQVVERNQIPMLMPTSQGRLLWILGAVAAHIKASVSTSEGHEKQRSNFQETISHLRDRLVKREKDLEILQGQAGRDVDEVGVGPFHVYHNRTGRYLASGNKPHEAIQIARLHWTAKSSEALSWASRADLLRWLDTLAENHAQRAERFKGLELDPQLVVGVPLAEIKVSSMAIHRPLV